MVLSCFLLIANICLPPTSTQVTVVENNVARHASATYAGATVRIADSPDDRIEYDWPASSSVGATSLRYWKYKNAAEKRLEYIINIGDPADNTLVFVDENIAKDILNNTFVVTGKDKISLSDLATTQNLPRPNRKNKLHP